MSWNNMGVDDGNWGGTDRPMSDVDAATARAQNDAILASDRAYAATASAVAGISAAHAWVATHVGDVDVDRTPFVRAGSNGYSTMFVRAFPDGSVVVLDDQDMGFDFTPFASTADADAILAAYRD